MFFSEMSISMICLNYLSYLSNLLEITYYLNNKCLLLEPIPICNCYVTFRPQFGVPKTLRPEADVPPCPTPLVTPLPLLPCPKSAVFVHSLMLD